MSEWAEVKAAILADYQRGHAALRVHLGCFFGVFPNEHEPAVLCWSAAKTDTAFGTSFTYRVPFAEPPSIADISAHLDCAHELWLEARAKALADVICEHGV